MRRSPHRRVSALPGACLLVAVLSVLPPPAAAAEKLHWAELDEIQAAFDFLVGMDFEKYTVVGLSQEPREAQKFFLGQRLGAYGEGSFVHPRFWYWRALVDVLFIEDLVGGQLSGVSLSHYPVAPYEAERYAIEPEFDVQFTFLQDHPYPITAHAARHTHMVRREFMSNYWLNTLTAGGSAGWHNKDFPFSVQYGYLLNEGDERELASGAEQHQVYATGKNETDDSRTLVEYRLNDYANRYFSDSDYTLHYGLVQSGFDLDEDDDYRLDLTARAQHRDFTAFTQDEVRLATQLLGDLHESLRLRVQNDLAWWNLHDVDGFQVGLWSDLRHQLFASLTTGVLGRVTWDTAQDTDRVEGGVSGSVTYRKDLGPLVMTHGYFVAGTWTDFGHQAAINRVLDEAVTLEGEIPMPLAWPDVDGGSIEVLDSTRTVRYRRDLDFRIEQRDDRTYIQRTTGGDIPDGATVLVSYEYRLSQEATATQLDQQYFGRLETDLWEYLRIYGQYTFRDDRRFLQGLDDVVYVWHEAVAGMEGGADGARASAEYHWVNAEHYTAHQVSVGASYTIPITLDFKPLLGLRELYLDVGISGERKNLLELFSEAAFRIYGPVDAEWHVSYQWEDGGPNDGQYVFGQTRVNWRIRKILLWFEYEVALERKERQSYDRHSITINVRRMF